MRGTVSKIVGIVFIVAATVMLWRFIDLLPVIGDPNSEPNTHIAQYFITKGPSETNSPNLVTGVLADYRGLDTMLETTVLYLASIAVTLIMSKKESEEEAQPSFERIRLFGITEIKVVMPLIVPILLLYAGYVLVHGEVSLGGGFQAGALIAMAYILYSFIDDEDARKFRLTQHSALCIGAMGLLIYFLTGVVPMFFGGHFLEYGKLPIPGVSQPQLHSIGIILIEVGVTICVAASIITILEGILERKHIR
ncbi:MAG: hydrogen gas-evolving membrane-bound hydrogenase subunit E [Emergencia sp.]